MNDAADDPADDDLPLAGVKVLDLSRVLAGPWCAMVLGDFGADVLKIEHPERGDDTRDWGNRTGETTTTYFDSINRNKRSISLDLHSETGIAEVGRLVKNADILVQNFKFGGADRLGIGYEAMAAINPGLIYCSVSGYPPDGPEAARPGYDLLVQGEAGLMAINGEADQPPLKFGVAVVDLFTGQYAAQAVLAALYRRSRTGRGSHVALSLFDCGQNLLVYYGLDALHDGRDPPRWGNAHPSIVPYGVYETADGPLVVTVGNNAQFLRFCTEVIERPDIAADPRFRTNLDRGTHRAALIPEILRELRARPRAELRRRLDAAGIPGGEVLGVHEALTSERTRRAGGVVQETNAQGERFVLAPPYRIDGRRLQVRMMPPPLERV
ncbi:crotonobetainyl-CoA:carnitine CoA-transferase CaiB-like acyl-CoA transferase [Endobacter medicaginis]|uniref:Crotonobetainyl-CoA:carnitine CoA-transferase CaiB-like acyl-CoA transferase n=2 Tax=Endobacter medicaginis TaxID=1181271 RepID=A0A839UYJ0_9PROT|nr:CaiB/BaiF CoA-transferase family protein [Endobacter medicaginis]MBB3172462.1 crotonobetainyl-CoA:carnitine CoA-transferase CaiB-like acyl-CoA transferase [Endobacter medicaginis]MCX5474049.1 CaiB/BaiF CoA-transferase family protein [Endobacter medicaginis]